MKYNFTFLAIGIMAVSVSAQNNNSSAAKATGGTNKLWVASPDQLPENIKAFQENKGQFVNTLNDWPVVYGADLGSTKVLFTTKGVIYDIAEKVKMTDEDVKGTEKGEVSAQIKQEQEAKYKTVHHKVAVEWENASTNIALESIGKTSFHFGGIDPEKVTGIDNINGYEEIVYHNVYPGIDIDFTFHPKQGIKYAVKLQAGYDASVFKMHITGHNGLTIDENGDMHIKTVMGDIIDHAPVTTQNGKLIASAFQMAGENEVAFKLGDANKSLPIIIDPWTTIPSVSGTIETDIGTDANNNIYVLEWDTNGTLYEQKYNSAGALLWTYNFTQYGTHLIVSDLAVDPTGKSYISQPYYYINGSGYTYALACLSSAGVLLYFDNTRAGNDIFETWNLEYSVKYGELVEAGSPGGAAQQVGIAFAANGAVLTTYQDTAISEIYTGTAAPNGYYYAISSNHCLCNSGAGAYTEQLEKFDISGSSPTLVWNKPIPHYNFREFEFKNPAGHGGDRGVPMNGIVAGPTSVYTTNGKWLYLFDANSGALLDSNTIAGGMDTLNVNAGIAVDSCNKYVYVGNQSSVMAYDATTLVFDTSYTTPGIVYDMVIGGGRLTVCGNTPAHGFIEQFSTAGCSALGVNELAGKEVAFNIYPNPSSGIFNVVMNGQKEAGVLNVYNSLGQLILTTSVHANQQSFSLNLSSFATGIYLYRAISETGQLIGSGKLIKE